MHERGAATAVRRLRENEGDNKLHPCMRAFATSSRRVIELTARAHTPAVASTKASSPRAIAVEAELATPPMSPGFPPAPQSQLVPECPLPASPSADAAEVANNDLDIVGGILSGEIDSTNPESLTFALPSSAEGIEADGVLARLIIECHMLLRADYPIFALNRLLHLTSVLEGAGRPSLRLTGDWRVDEVLAVERQMHSTLEAMRGDTWKLICSKKALSVKTYLRMASGGRLDIKAEGVLPRGMSSCLAPLLHVRPRPLAR